MKKLLSIAAASLLTLALTSCGESDSSAKKVRIGVSIPAADHGWTGGVVWYAEKAKRDLEKSDPNLEITVSTARDAAEQVSKIENLLVRKIDALVVLPQEPGPLTAICEQARKQGVYLVTVDRGLDKEVQNLNVAGDNAGFGRAAAQALAGALKGKGDIVIMEGIPCVVNSDRVNAFREEIAKYPDIRILESQSAYWDTEKGLKLMENFLQKYPKIDAVWVGDDDVLIGAYKALQESGRKDVKLMLGGGGSKVIIKKVLDRDPIVSMTVTYPPRMIEDGIRAAVQAIREGKQNEPAARLVVPSEIITQENAKSYYYPDSIY